jgi:HK97 gp10 family phage protein
MAELDVSQVLALGADLDRASGRIGRKAASVVRKSAQRVKTEAQANAPVQTGALRSSIQVTTSGDGRGSGISATIGPTVRYAQFVEYGTSKMAPEPFLGPALSSVEPSFLEAMAQLAEEETLG